MEKISLEKLSSCSMTIYQMKIWYEITRNFMLNSIKSGLITMTLIIDHLVFGVTNINVNTSKVTLSDPIIINVVQMAISRWKMCK